MTARTAIAATATTVATTALATIATVVATGFTAGSEIAERRTHLVVECVLERHRHGAALTRVATR